MIKPDAKFILSKALELADGDCGDIGTKDEFHFFQFYSKNQDEIELIIWALHDLVGKKVPNKHKYNENENDKGINGLYGFTPENGDKNNTVSSRDKQTESPKIKDDKQKREEIADILKRTDELFNKH